MKPNTPEQRKLINLWSDRDALIRVIPMTKDTHTYSLLKVKLEAVKIAISVAEEGQRKHPVLGEGK